MISGKFGVDKIIHSRLIKTNKHHKMLCYSRSRKSNHNIIGINRKQDKMLMKVIAMKKNFKTQELFKNWNTRRQVINQINERARLHSRQINTKSRQNSLKNQLWRLGRLTKEVQVQDQDQGWASGQIQGWASGQVQECWASGQIQDSRLSDVSLKSWKSLKMKSQTE